MQAVPPATVSKCEPSAACSKAMLWTGRVITVLCILFLLFDCLTKIIPIKPIRDQCAQMGFNDTAVLSIGLALLISTILYAIPATNILGAILITGYMGGAIATNVQHNAGAFPIIMAAFIGVLTWLGIFLRDPSLRQLTPVRRACC